MYSKVIQLYIDMYLFFFKFFPHLGCYRILSSVPVLYTGWLVRERGRGGDAKRSIRVGKFRPLRGL